MKIKSPLVKGKIVQLKPRVYAAVIPNRYERGMLFCRYQEFYESPHRKIKGKIISFEEMMNVYVKLNKLDSFNYPAEWAGYNLPSQVLWKAVDEFHYSYKGNGYDELMKNIAFYCENDVLNKTGERKPWYLICAESSESSLMKHELAHGLYYTNKEYYNSCQLLINNMRKIDYESIKKKLIKMQYCPDKKIIDDEIQAYLSTGLYPSMKTKAIEAARKPFIKNLKKFL